MNATRRELIMQRGTVIQHELLPELKNVRPADAKVGEGHLHAGMGAYRGIHGVFLAWCGAPAARAGVVSKWRMLFSPRPRWG